MCTKYLFFLNPEDLYFVRYNQVLPFSMVFTNMKFKVNSLYITTIDPRKDSRIVTKCWKMVFSHSVHQHLSRDTLAEVRVYFNNMLLTLWEIWKHLWEYWGLGPRWRFWDYDGYLFWLLVWRSKEDYWEQAFFLSFISRVPLQFHYQESSWNLMTGLNQELYFSF